MPPPSLLSSDDHERQPEPARGEQPADVVGERDVADQQHGRPGPGGRDAERGRDRAVDAVGAAVGEHARRRVAGGEERLDVAHRHRGGDHERRVGRQPHAELGRDARLRELAERAGDGDGGGAVGTAPAVEPGAVLARLLRRQHARVGGHDRADAPRRVLPGGLGIEGDLQRVEPVQPLAQRLGGREVAEAQDEVGGVGGGEAGVAQQRVVVGDRGGTAAGAGQRLGEQRQREPVGEPRQRRAEPGVALAAARDHDRARVGVERGAQPVDQRGLRRPAAPAAA